jgi:hypothetical protein
LVIRFSPLRGVQAIALALGLAALAATAQTSDVKITGTFGGATGLGDSVQGSFSCTGVPTCSGTYSATLQSPGCSNTFSIGDLFQMTGVNVSAQPAPVAGSITFKNAEFDDTGPQPDGTCAIKPNSFADLTVQYTGQWDGVTGRISIAEFPGITGTYKADVAPPPVFPMVVTSNINSVSATASAAIQYRPQDVGTQGSVFVFAVAPAAQVRGGRDPGAMKVGKVFDSAKGLEKADSCVISQLNSSGQLVSVSITQLQAFLSGTLSAQGASVSILNGTPTPNVAGATFYVGYGTTAQRMLNDGIFRNAVLVPGNDVCPMLPSQTALWWNPSESGWGLNLNHQGATIFGTLFTYDASRAPLWLVMSGGRMQSDGVTYIGDLYRTTGPAFNANPFTPIGASNITKVGTMTLRFTDANVGTLTYSVNNVQVVKDVQRQVYGSRSANCLPTSESRATSTNYQDLWWNPSESGWGLNITHQDNTLFATLFTYDASGRDLWLVMSGGARQADGSYSGELYQTSGPAFNAVPFNGVTVTTVGTMRLRFTDGDNGTLTYTYNGVTVNKSIQRQVFSTTFSLCN